jgi:scyllo-inositol 2-dehydrogenase (NADP+)
MISSTPIVTALLSYGMSGEVFHAPLLQAHPGFTLYASVQRKSSTSKNRYPQVLVYTDFEHVVKDKIIELVVVNTPNETHYDYSRRLLESGKHVVVEKPFTVTSREAADLISLAQQKNRVLTVFQSRRWDGDFLTLKKVIENKWLGKIVEFESHYDRFRNYIQPNTWKEESRPGTGILYNLGSHLLDQVLILFGSPQEADARIGIQRPGGAVDDFYDIRLIYDGFQVIVKSSYLVREPGPRYILHGTEGSFIQYGIDSQEEALKNGEIPGSPGWGQGAPDTWGRLNTTLNGLHTRGRVETIPGNYLKFYDNVYSAIREQKELAVKPEESMKVIELIELCYESNRLRKAIQIQFRAGK